MCIVICIILLKINNTEPYMSRCVTASHELRIEVVGRSNNSLQNAQYSLISQTNGTSTFSKGITFATFKKLFS